MRGTFDTAKRKALQSIHPLPTICSKSGIPHEAMPCMRWQARTYAHV